MFGAHTHPDRDVPVQPGWQGNAIEGLRQLARLLADAAGATIDDPTVFVQGGEVSTQCHIGRREGDPRTQRFDRTPL